MRGLLSAFMFVFLLLAAGCAPESATRACELSLEEQQELEKLYLDYETSGLELAAAVCSAEKHFKDDGTSITKDEWDAAVAELLKAGYLSREGADMRILRQKFSWTGKYEEELEQDAGNIINDELVRRRMMEEKLKHGYVPMEAYG